MGKEWAMRFCISRRLNVAYAAGEGLSGLKARFKAAVQYHGAYGIKNFRFFDLVPQLFDAGDGIGRFVSEWQADQAAGSVEPLDLLVIDTLHSATVGADENSAQDTGKVLQAVKNAQRALGCAVILIHHTNKTGSAERGSSALRGAMDAMIELEPSDKKTIMRCAKLKDAEEWKAQTLDLVTVEGCESVRVWWDEPADKQGSKKQDGNIAAIIALLKKSPKLRYTVTAIGEAIGFTGGKSKIYKLMTTARDQETGIQTGLKKPDQDAGPHNPTMYWYDDGGVAALVAEGDDDEREDKEDDAELMLVQAGL